MKNGNVMGFITVSEPPQINDIAKTKKSQEDITKNKLKCVKKAINKDRNTFGKKSLVQAPHLKNDNFSDFQVVLTINITVTNEVKLWSEETDVHTKQPKTRLQETWDFKLKEYKWLLSHQKRHQIRNYAHRSTFIIRITQEFWWQV